MIDDDVLLTDMVAESLTYCGHDVIVCNISLAAVQIYETEFKAIDMIILDMTMPVLGGKAAFEALRRINPDAKVLISSGYCGSAEADAMLQAGATRLGCSHTQQVLDSVPVRGSA